MRKAISSHKVKNFKINVKIKIKKNKKIFAK